MDKRVIIVSLVVVVIAVLIIFLQWRAANVIVDIGEQTFRVNDYLGGTLSITLEPGDSIQKDTPILVTLTKNNTVLQAATLTFQEFIEQSSNPINPTNKDNNLFYDQVGT